MTQENAKNQYYSMQGFTLTGQSYAMKLAELDDMEAWAARPALPLSNKCIPSSVWHPSISRIILGLLP